MTRLAVVVLALSVTVLDGWGEPVRKVKLGKMKSRSKRKEQTK